MKILQYIKPLYFIFVVILSTLFYSCAHETVAEKNSVQTTGLPTTYNPEKEITLSNENKIGSNDSKKENSSSHYLTIKELPDTGQLTYTQFTLRENIIDSLNNILPAFDTSKYNLKSISYFTYLSKALNGKTFFADNSDEMIKDLMEILTSRLDDGTDIVFLIDKTGSMDDDIDKVQESMNVILSYLKKFNNVRLGIAAYGDKNWHHDLWYNYVDLTSDVTEVEDFLSSFNTIGNPDVAESVNDAIVETLENMNWKKDNNRLMLIIGDAPSQLPPNSGFSTEEVIKKCDSMNVKLNLYPIVLAVSEDSKNDLVFSSDFAKIFPVPAINYLTLKVTKQEQYWYSIIDISGKQVKNGTFNQKEFVVDLSNINSGNYLIQIQNQDASLFYTQMVPITH